MNINGMNITGNGNIMIGYGYPIYDPNYLSQHDKDRLELIAKSGSQIEFETWITHSIAPAFDSKSNHENLNNSSFILITLARHKRLDFMKYFVTQRYCIELSARIFDGDELISDDCIPIYEWFNSSPFKDRTSFYNYRNIIKRAQSAQQMRLYLWMVNNVPDPLLSAHIQELIRYCELDASYMTLKTFIDNFSAIYISQNQRDKMVCYEACFQLLEEFVISDVLNVIKLYC